MSGFRPATTLLAGVALALALGGVGCRARACRAGTLLVTVYGERARATEVRFVLSVGGARRESGAYPFPESAATLEVDLGSGYAAGQAYTLEAEALLGGAVVAAGRVEGALTPTCSPLSIEVAPPVTEGGADMERQADLAAAD